MSRPLTMVLAALLTASLLAGCSADPESDNASNDPPSPTKTPTAEESSEPDPDEVTFASLGIDDWPTDVDLLAGAPPARELEPALHERLTRAIAGIADLAITDSRMWSDRDALDILTAETDEPFRSLLPLAFEQATSDRIAAVNHFGREVEVVDGPLVQHVWDVRPAEGGIRLYLQTWSAYEVREGAGPTRVIGMYREWYRLESANGSTGWAWRESGADLCVQATEDRFSPAADRAEDKELAWFVRTGQQHRFELRSLPGNIDEETEQDCQEQ